MVFKWMQELLKARHTKKDIFWGKEISRKEKRVFKFERVNQRGGGGHYCLFYHTTYIFFLKAINSGDKSQELIITFKPFILFDSFEYSSMKFESFFYPLST